MSMYKKAIVILLLVTLTLSLPAYAATEIRAGKTAAVTFVISDIFGIDGYFEFSNKDLFSDISYRNNSSMIGNVSEDGVYLYGSASTTVSVEIKVTAGPKAAVGDSCDIVFHYETSDEDGQMSEWMTMTQTVTVKQEEVTTDTTRTDPPETHDTPHTDPVDDTDYSELQKQLDAVDRLNENDYTQTSWKTVASALELALNARGSGDQAAVDAGANALKNAINSLVAMDYTGLKEAIEGAQNVGDISVRGDRVKMLFELVNRARTVLTSRDQNTVDNMTNEINTLVAQIKEEYRASQETTAETAQPIELVREVVKEVEVLPKGPYCNTSAHKVWPVVFFISLAINLMLAALIFIYVMKRRKLRKDDTPLVDYSIEDDE